MKTYLVTIYTRSNACVSPNKIVSQQVFEAKTAKSAKINAWHFFDAWYNSVRYSRHDLRIEATPLEAE